MSTYSRQALVGHIGGTFISLAIADIDELTVANFALLSSADFTTPIDAIERYLRSVPRCPDMVGLAVAGTVKGDAVAMTYQPWNFDRAGVARITGASRIVIVPDLEALARSLPSLSDYDLVEVRHGKARKHATKALIAVGTGLSVAGLAPSGDDWSVVPALPGLGLPLAGADELELRRAFSADAVPAADDVLTGEGLATLYNAICKTTGQNAGSADPARIIRAGVAGEDAAAGEALGRFAAWLGRLAGDVALLFGAEGGLYLGGVIAPNMAPILAGERFRAAFEGSGVRQRSLSPIRVSVIKTAADAGLRGAAIALARSVAAAEGGAHRSSTIPTSPT